MGSFVLFPQFTNKMALKFHILQIFASRAASAKYVSSRNLATKRPGRKNVVFLYSHFVLFAVKFLWKSETIRYQNMAKLPDFLRKWLLKDKRKSRRDFVFLKGNVDLLSIGVKLGCIKFIQGCFLFSKTLYRDYKSMPWYLLSYSRWWTIYSFWEQLSTWIHRLEGNLF